MAGVSKRLSIKAVALKRVWMICALAGPIAAPAPAAAAIDYALEFRGAPNGLREALETISVLARRERNYPTLTALSVVARRDTDALEKALQAAGYYAGEASYEIEEAGSDGKPRIVFYLDPGPRFRISDYRIFYTDEQEADRPESLDTLGVEAEGSASGAALQDAQQSFLTGLWNEGYPAARIVGRRAEAKFSEGEAIAIFEFESGPRATFGEIEIEGTKDTDDSHLKKMKTWDEGDRFDRSKLVSYRDRLAFSGLFRSVDVSPGPPGEDGAAPILVDVEERKRRTIGAGVSYSTSEGPGGRLFFEYRNAFHRGERINLELKGTEVEQSFVSTFDKPLPAFPGSAFSRLAFENETTDAYKARTVALSGGLARRWLDDRLETRAGVGFESSKVRDDLLEERTYFVSAPLSATWNTEDDLLAPTKGVRAALSLTPYTGTDTFTIAEANGRSRVHFGADDRFTLAFRAKLGAIMGSPFADIPLNKRFYAGGGGSVRGYVYQEVGPLDASGDPVGGRSLIEASFETRAKITEKIQLAAFVDAGSVSSTTLPDFGGDIFVGAGMGARYFTPVGPIRLDVATPLDKRETDRSFQIYISLGQPF